MSLNPRQPFLDWLHATDPPSADITLADLAQDPSIYLIPECDNEDEEVNVLREIYAAIFEEQLAAWETDRSRWPSDRSLAVFRRWFDCQHHSMLIDPCDEPLIRESE